MKNTPETGLWLAITAGVLCPALVTVAQNPSSAPQTAGHAGVITEEVIVTGSNIPTAEEVGPNPVDTYRPQDIERLGIRNATDLLTKLPQELGATINQNIANGGDGSVVVNLRGLLPKETLVLVDGKRIAGSGLFENVADDFSKRSLSEAIKICYHRRWEFA